MRNEYRQHVDRQSTWATPMANVVLWTAVIALAVAGALMLPVHGDTGVLLLVAAMIVAAPASATSRHRSHL